MAILIRVGDIAYCSSGHPCYVFTMDIEDGEQSRAEQLHPLGEQAPAVSGGPMPRCSECLGGIFLTHGDGSIGVMNLKGE